MQEGQGLTFSPNQLPQGATEFCSKVVRPRMAEGTRVLIVEPRLNPPTWLTHKFLRNNRSKIISKTSLRNNMKSTKTPTLLRLPNRDTNMESQPTTTSGITVTLRTLAKALTQQTIILRAIPAMKFKKSNIIQSITHPNQV